MKWVVASMVLATLVYPAADSLGASSEPALARGWERVRAADFETALATLEPLVRRLSLAPGREKDLASAHLALGVACLLGLGQEKAARGHFREALRHNPDATVDSLKQPARVVALLDDIRAQVRAARHLAAVGSAWSEALRQAEDAGRPEAARSAALRQFLGQFPDPNPHRAAAERLLDQLQASVRKRLAVPPDPKNLGRLPKATYVSGTLLNLKEGTHGGLSVAEPERMVFVANDRRTFIPIGYGRIVRLEYGLTASVRSKAAAAQSLAVLTKKKDRYLTVTFDDLDAQRQAMVLELEDKQFRLVLATLEARSGVKVEYHDETVQER